MSISVSLEIAPYNSPPLDSLLSGSILQQAKDSTTVVPSWP